MLLSTQEMSQMMDRGDEEWADLQEGDTIAEPDDTAVDAQFLEEEPPPDSRTDAHNPCGEAEVTTDMDERFNDLCFLLLSLLMLASVTPPREAIPPVHFSICRTVGHRM
jgi:hypothetical protein